MHSIRSKITCITVCIMVAAMIIAGLLGVAALRNVGNLNADQTLLLLCEMGQKNLNHYFASVEQSVETVSNFVESDLDGLDDERLQAHLDRVSGIFKMLTYNTNGILTYYYRIDPAVSHAAQGFWFVNLDGKGFVEHEVTDITRYDTSDTSQLVWYTVPKATGEGVWLPPYVTDNLDARVISYNVPVSFQGQFVGVIGIELDYSAMAEDVNNITLYENGYAFLNDADGVILYHPRMDVTTMDTQPKVPDGLLGSEQFIRYTFEGVEKQAVWLPLMNGGRLNVTVPVTEINADWHNWSVHIAFAFTALLILYAALILTFVGRLTKPLREITAVAEQISQGNYDCELRYQKKDEIGTLAKTFNKVSANIKQYIKDLNSMAFVDALTGIRNRMALRHDYDSYQGREVTVMMLDLNDFKTINDTRGHEEGDRILRETGRLLAGAFGEDYCYRYGGDEFLVIVPDISEAEFHGKLIFLNQNAPAIDGASTASFSIGFTRAFLHTPDMLRSLISSADVRMYEEKRDKKRTVAAEHEMALPRMKASEYSVEEMKAFLAQMSGKYALARLVDPVECRIIELQDDGRININESCYGIWNSEQRCINCTSAIACRTGCHQEKAERFRDKNYFIQSNPVKLRLSNGSLYDAVVELVDVESESEGEGAVNHREAENVGTRAAHYLAHHDSLTNVLNADAFYELAREMILNSPETAWVMITSNIMNFRLINTLFGVQKGNEVLMRTASLLRELSEDARGQCGRLGGDQFALLIPRDKYDEKALCGVARKLTEAFNSGVYTFCIHFGVYRIDDASIPVSVMCGRANSALHSIRDDLTQTVACFDDTLWQKILLEQQVLGSFTEALKGGQFKMYLQPLVDQDGSVIGGEALARWIKADGTVIMPGDFIETLETAGLIQELDMHIWELAVKQLREWKGTDKGELMISVNISAKDFYSIDVYDVLTGLVEKYDVDSRLLRLEITETALVGDPEKTDAIISRLRQRGFLMEIDDFGKDNSSLNLLRHIKADVLKIDMSFLQEIRDKERTRIILESLISMAGALGMEVVTEGVETERQFRALIDMGCGFFQGFYFSKPIPVDAFVSLCADRKKA